MNIIVAIELVVLLSTYLVAITPDPHAQNAAASPFLEDGRQTKLIPRQSAGVCVCVCVIVVRERFYAIIVSVV